VASSDKAYGDAAKLPYTEATPLDAKYPYDTSKLCTDFLTRSYVVSYGLPATIARCGNIYGGGDLNWERIVPGTIRSLLADERPVIRSAAC
jgi:CDP-glucose 4,6-dehydratase